jgi:hypothetical protein
VNQPQGEYQVPKHPPVVVVVVRSISNKGKRIKTRRRRRRGHKGCSYIMTMQKKKNKIYNRFSFPLF